MERDPLRVETWTDEELDAWCALSDGYFLTRWGLVACTVVLLLDPGARAKAAKAHPGTAIVDLQTADDLAWMVGRGDVDPVGLPAVLAEMARNPEHAPSAVAIAAVLKAQKAFNGKVKLKRAPKDKDSERIWTDAE